MFEHDPLATLLLVLTGFQVVALAAAWTILRRRPAEPPHQPGRLDRLADRPRAAIALVFAAAVALSAALSLAHWPVPRIQDEFSYRLAGETFAAGRMANEPHPMWRHFETEHVLHQPTYASKYPPMQGLNLAAGNLLAGEPILGAWLGLGAACAAVCWMFYAFLPARWALTGGLIVATHPWIVAWWGHSGWGGQMAMLGGALLFGSVRRLAGSTGGVRPHAGDALLMGLGLTVLANSRPFEGLVASLPAAAAMAWYLLGPRRPGIVDAFTRIVVPVGAVLALTGAAMTAYNERVTGDPLTLPYQLHSRTYGATPMFLWQDLPPAPEHPERKLRDFYEGWERSLAIDQQTAYGLSRKLLHKTLQLGGFYLGPALGVGLAGLMLVRRRGRAAEDDPVPGRGWTAFAALAATVTIAASLLCVWFNPHYVAPIAPLLLLLAVLGVRRLADAGGRARQAAASVIAAHAATATALLIAPPIVYPMDDWSHARARMIDDLTARGGEHLVILRHGREYTPHEEWVYNAADIDGSPVVWARELDSESSRELRRYYRDRTHWLLEAYRPASPDGTPAPVPTLRPYPTLPEWLGSPPRVLLPGEPIATVGAADLDGDGTAEFLIAPLSRPALLVYRAGAWDAPATIDLPAPALALVAEEAAPGSARRVAAVLAGMPALAVISADASAVTLIDLPAPAVALATVPGEGLVAVSCPSPAGVAFVGWDGGGISTPWIPVGGEPHGVAAADLTGDGVPDVALCDRTGGAVWLLTGQRGGGSWAVGEPARIAHVPEALGLVAADLSGDGRASLAAVSAARDELVVLRRRDDGTFERETLNTGVIPLSVVSTDVDGDGSADLAVATRWGHGLTVLMNTGAGGFAAPAEVTLGTRTWFAEKASRLAAGDLDGDGIGDIAVAGAGGVHLFLSDVQ